MTDDDDTQVYRSELEAAVAAERSKLQAQEFEIYKLGYKQGASDERLMCADLFEQMTLTGYPQAIVIAAVRARGEKK